MAFTYTKRKDGRLVKKISIKGQKPIYIYSNNPKDLEKQYIEIQYKKNNGAITDISNITFKTYAEKWFEINISQKEEATQKSVRNRLNHLYKYIGDIKLKNLKKYQIQEISTNMVKEGYTDVTNRTIAECKRILQDAVENDIISKNVAIGIKAIKFPKNERKTLTIDEDKKVTRIALNHKYGAFILVLRYCGLRPEEAVALTIDDVDVKNKLLNVNKAVSLANNQPKIKATKNLKNRKIPIPDFLVKILTQEIQQRKKENTKYLFVKEKDRKSMLTKQALKAHLNTFLNAVNNDLEEPKIIHFSYYQLRHSYCTMLYYADIKIKKAQELMGHSSAKMVYDIYAHLDELRENADERINSYISDKILTDNTNIK